MMKAIISVSTFIFIFLPSFAAGFNHLLSINEPPAEKIGKVIKESQIGETDYRIKTVVIDPGHGGHDPGCLGANSQEKNIALAIGKKLAAYIQQTFPSVRVIMTRDEDVFIPLHERAAIANRNDADLFISIHCNFIPKRPAVAGSETYVMGLHTAEHNLSVAKRENSAILLESDYQKNYDYDPNSPEGHIMLSMFQNAYLEQSILFAERVEDKFKTQAGRNSRGVKQAGFVVLKETAMPSVLVETGFLSNSDEEEYLLTDEGQTAIALALLKAFEEYNAMFESGGIAGSNSLPPQAVAVNTPKTYTPPKVEKPAEPKESKPGKEPVSVVADNSTPPSYSTSAEISREPKIIPMTVQPQGEFLEKGMAAGVSGIRFHVQIAAGPNPISLNDPKWNTLGYLVEMIQEDNLYKYQARNFSSLQQAFEARLLIQARGFPDAFIVAYKNGQRISMEQARKELGL